MAPYDATTNPFGGAQWQYIAANLKLKATGDDAVPATWIKEFGDVEVGFVGAVTEELPGLVSPGGIADIDVEGIVDSVNTEAADLVAEGADLVVMLVHEGAPTTNCATMNQRRHGVGRHRQHRLARRRRHRVRAHAPRVQLLVPGRAMGDRGSGRDRTPGRLRRPVRHEPQPARSSPSTA